jgi:hypothetical protein
MLPDPITVPAEDVGKTVQSFIDEDEVKQMVITRQTNGNYTITPKE